jgi:HPt (histidine-containing phosphotransfer) domain-containing protein
MPIIALTAAVSAEEKLSYKNHGIDGTLNKPFNEQELYHTIKEHFPQLLGEVSVRVSSHEVVANSVGKHYSSKDLYSMGDEQFVKDMLQVFVDTTTRGMQNLNNNCKRKNWSAVADAAHQMIPSCRHMEANALMNILKNIETEIRDNNRMNLIPDLVAQAKNESKLLLQEIKQEINRNA